MSMTIRRALTVPLIATALLGVAAGLPGSGSPATHPEVATAWSGGGCWNKPVLPDWCEFERP
jgi:hypothetical protein